MMIPLVNPCGTKRHNPNRPPKKWFYRKVAEAAKRGYARPERIVGDIWYHRISPAVKKRILKEYENPFNKRPALLRRKSQTSLKESGMVSFIRPRRKVRRARSRRRHNPKYGSYRPVLKFTHFGWKPSSHTRMLRRKSGALMRINPRHRRRVRHNDPDPRRFYARHNDPDPRRFYARRFHFRRYRRNPALPFDIGNVAMGGLKIAGGIVVGSMLMPVLVKFAPKDAATGAPKFRNFYGLVHVVIGAVAAGTIKAPVVKTIALTVAGTGVYDLIASNLKFLGMPPLPNTMPLLGGPVGSEIPQQIGDNYAPMLGSSYQPAGADFQAGGDDISYGGDEVEYEG